MTTTAPPSEFTTEFVPGNLKNLTSATGATKTGDLLMVPIDNIRVPEGLNVRIHSAEYQKHIEWLAESIIENGFYRNKPLKGYLGKDGDGTVIYVTDGFSRLAGAKLAVGCGAPIENLPVVLAPPGTNMADIVLGLALDNTGRPLKPYERGVVVKRLQSYGWDEKQIALKMRVTGGYVRNLQRLHSLPMALQQLVIEDKVSAGYAVQAANEHGFEEALKLISDALAEREEDANPITGDGADATEIEQGGTKGRERPQRQRRLPKPGVLSKKTLLAGIKYAIALPGDVVEFLTRFVNGDKDAIAEVESMNAKPKKTAGKGKGKAKATTAAAKAVTPPAGKGRGKGKGKASADSPKTPPTKVSQAAAQEAAAAEIGKAADKIAKSEPATPGDDEPL